MLFFVTILFIRFGFLRGFEDRLKPPHKKNQPPIYVFPVREKRKGTIGGENSSEHDERIFSSSFIDYCAEKPNRVNPENP
jgi:hypothetical protein